MKQLTLSLIALFTSIVNSAALADTTWQVTDFTIVCLDGDDCDYNFSIMGSVLSVDSFDTTCSGTGNNIAGAYQECMLTELSSDLYFEEPTGWVLDVMYQISEGDPVAYGEANVPEGAMDFLVPFQLAAQPDYGL
jgi:hypothetical protein